MSCLGIVTRDEVDGNMLLGLLLGDLWDVLDLRLLLDDRDVRDMHVLGKELCQLIMLSGVHGAFALTGSICTKGTYTTLQGEVSREGDGETACVA